MESLNLMSDHAVYSYVNNFSFQNCLVYLLPCCGIDVDLNAFMTPLSYLFLYPAMQLNQLLLKKIDWERDVTLNHGKRRWDTAWTKMDPDACNWDDIIWIYVANTGVSMMHFIMYTYIVSWAHSTYTFVYLKQEILGWANM